LPAAGVAIRAPVADRPRLERKASDRDERFVAPTSTARRGGALDRPGLTMPATRVDRPEDGGPIEVVDAGFAASRSCALGGAPGDRA
jgi:hypothetical protein